MQQIEPCNYWQQIKAEAPEIIEHLAVDTVLSPEIVDFLGGNVSLLELGLEQTSVPRAVHRELDEYELAMIAWICVLAISTHSCIA